MNTAANLWEDREDWLTLPKILGRVRRRPDSSQSSGKSEDTGWLFPKFWEEWGECVTLCILTEGLERAATGFAFPQAHYRCVRPMEHLPRHARRQPVVFATLMSREPRKVEEMNTLNDNDICNAEDIVMTSHGDGTTCMCEDGQPTMMAPPQSKTSKALNWWRHSTHYRDEDSRMTIDFRLLYTASALEPRFRTVTMTLDGQVCQLNLRPCLTRLPSNKHTLIHSTQNPLLVLSHSCQTVCFWTYCKHWLYSVTAATAHRLALTDTEHWQYTMHLTIIHPVY